jgi:tetratricopeptide (TPR) repeat protein
MPPPNAAPRGRRLAAGGILAIAVVAIYAPVASYGFLIYEDGAYVSDNPLVVGGLSVQALGAAVTSFRAAVWLPATWVSHMLDWSLFGDRAGFQHFTNVVLHALAAVLLFEWLRRATRQTTLALAAAALFAVHPLRVEAVAWLSSRKDVLSGVLLFATLLAWDGWVRAPSRGRYAAVLCAYAVGLASKSTLVPLPLALLALDAWPYRRLEGRAAVRARIVEKLPLAALALGAAVLTTAAARTGDAMSHLDASPLLGRLENAVVSLVAYLRDLVWPVGLAVHYPYDPDVPAWAWAGALAILAAITFAALRLRRRMPWLIAGWAWYVVMLLPMLGIVQVGSQARADRFTYLPMVGLGWALVWTLDSALPGQARRVAAAAGVAICGVLAALSARQVEFWRNDETLFRRALVLQGPNPVAHYNLANALQARADAGARGGMPPAEIASRLREAEALYVAAVEHRPYFADAHYNLANLLAGTGRPMLALQHYAMAVAARPSEPRMRNNFGVTLARLGLVAEARAQFEEALRLDPGFADARRNLDIANDAAAKAQP